MHEVHLLAILRLLGVLLILAVGALWIARQPGSPARDTLIRVGLLGTVIEMGALALDMRHMLNIVVQGAQLLFFIAMLAIAIRTGQNAGEDKEE